MKFSLFKFIRDRQGFSLVEVLVTLGFFGVVMLLFQTLVIMGGSFTKTTENRVQFNQITAEMKSHVCINSASFKLVGLHADKTFKFIPCTLSPCTPGTNDEEYQPLGSSDNRVSSPVMTVSLSGLGTESNLATAQNTIVQDTLNNYSGNLDQYTDFSVDGSPPAETGVRVNQDSHTFTKFDITANDPTNLMSADKIKGRIFISRCVERGTSATVYRKSGYSTTIDMDSPLSTLVYLLNLQRRPFYFPNAAGADRVQCCDTSSSPSSVTVAGSECNNSDDYNPITYVVHFKGRSPIAGVSSSNVFSAEMTYIHEYPAMSEMSTIYGSGFLFTLDEQQQEPQKFFLDLLVLKNSCNTNFGRTNACASISLETDVTAFQVNNNQNLSDVIFPSVASCTGTVSTMDSSIIQL